VLGKSVNVNAPASRSLSAAALLWLGVALILAVPWLAAAIVFILQLRQGRRRFSRLRPKRLGWTLLWAILTLVLWYWIYSPIRLFLPPSFPDFWPMPQTGYVMAALLAWLVYSVVIAFSDRQDPLRSVDKVFHDKINPSF
jgi:hypothetical protein